MIKMIDWLISVITGFSQGRRLSLDRTLEQRRDDLALEQDEHHKGGHEDQNRAGAQQGDIGGIVALECSKRTGHRSLTRVLDEY